MSSGNTKGVAAIIVSAGLGKRMPKDAKKKNFLLLNDRLVLVHTLLPFEMSSLVTNVVIVTGADDIEHCKKEVIESYGLKKIAGVVAGGKERQDSVAAGLDFINQEGIVDDPEKLIVAVHDGARCLVTTEIIDRVIEGAGTASAAAAMVKVKDTIKQGSSNDSFIERTLDREHLYSVQTPQAFTLALINRAFTSAREDDFLGTDTSSLVERIGEKVLIVEGSYENIKITTGEDLHLARKILQSRESGGREE